MLYFKNTMTERDKRRILIGVSNQGMQGMLTTALTLEGISQETLLAVETPTELRNILLKGENPTVVLDVDDMGVDTLRRIPPHVSRVISIMSSPISEEVERLCNERGLLLNKEHFVLEDFLHYIKEPDPTPAQVK
jgi:hypothetical protein